MELDLFHFEDNRKSFEDCFMENGFRYLYARDLMKMLGYSDYASFKKTAINRAMTVCMTLEIETDNNFKPEARIIEGKELPDCRLSKFACYLVTLNADVKKIEVARAQAYFITLTEAFEKYIREPEQVERVAIRGEVSEREKSLSSTAKLAGVTSYAFFQNEGYRGLYNMSLKQLKMRKGIPANKSPLDFMGREELAANLFRITQTEAKIRNDDIRGQKGLEKAAYGVGRAVRNTMEEISGTKPENLLIDSDIKKVKATIKSTQKEFVKIEKKGKNKGKNTDV